MDISFKSVVRERGIADIFLEACRYAVFILFCILAIRFIFITFNNVSKKGLIICWVIFLTVFLLSWLKTKMSLYGFIILVPLVSGLQLIGVMRNISLPSFIFSSFYTSWILKHLYYGKGNFSPKSEIGNLVDIFSGTVLLSLVSIICIYPADFTLYRFWLPAQGQDDIFYGIESAYVLLQGLFFYRILENEMLDINEWKRFKLLIYIQAVIIIIFSLVQILFHIPGLYWPRLGINAPFDDLHSYASCILIFIFIFWAHIYDEKRRFKIMNAFFLGLFLILIILTGSKIAWLSLSIVGIGLIYRSSGRKAVIIALCLLVGILVYLNIFNPQWLDKDLLGRIDAFSSILKYQESGAFQSRSYLWHRALNIIEENPFLGTGIGTFFRVSTAYYPTYGPYGTTWHENAHNYYLQIAAELGIPALCLFLFIIFTIYNKSLQLLSISDEIGINTYIKGLLLGLTAYLMTCLTGHPLLHVTQQFMFWFIIAAIMMPSNLSKMMKEASK